MDRLPVTRERIAEAALEILDAAPDESALTMRALAGRLDVQAPSLYAHITGMDEVLALVHARINASIDLTPLVDADPLSGLRQFAYNYRDAYRRHPVAATIIMSRSINAAHALDVYEPVASCLFRAGIPTNQVMPCMSLLDILTLGSAVEPFAAGFTKAPARYRHRYPALSNALRHSRRRQIDDDGFHLGLDAFIGIISALARPEA